MRFAIFKIHGLDRIDLEDRIDEFLEFREQTDRRNIEFTRKELSDVSSKFSSLLAHVSIMIAVTAIYLSLMGEHVSYFLELVYIVELASYIVIAFRIIQSIGAYSLPMYVRLPIRTERGSYQHPFPDETNEMETSAYVSLWVRSLKSYEFLTNCVLYLTIVFVLTVLTGFVLRGLQ